MIVNYKDLIIGKRYYISTTGNELGNGIFLKYEDNIVYFKIIEQKWITGIDGIAGFDCYPNLEFLEY